MSTEAEGRMGDMAQFPATIDDWFEDADGWWSKPDSPERRAALGHQYDHSAPGYCTCGRWQHIGTAGTRGGRIDPAPTAEEARRPCPEGCPGGHTEAEYYGGDCRGRDQEAFEGWGPGL